MQLSSMLESGAAGKIDMAQSPELLLAQYLLQQTNLSNAPAPNSPNPSNSSAQQYAQSHQQSHSPHPSTPANTMAALEAQFQSQQPNNQQQFPQSVLHNHNAPFLNSSPTFGSNSGYPSNIQHYSQQSPQQYTGGYGGMPQQMGTGPSTAPCTTIFVGNLGVHTTERDLLKLFDQEEGFKRIRFAYVFYSLFPS
jgi:hypothetical protein